MLAVFIFLFAASHLLLLYPLRPLSKLLLSVPLRWSVMRRRCVERSVMLSRTSMESGRNLSSKLKDTVVFFLHFLFYPKDVQISNNRTGVAISLLIVQRA